MQRTEALRHPMELETVADVWRAREQVGEPDTPLQVKHAPLMEHDSSAPCSDEQPQRCKAAPSQAVATITKPVLSKFPGLDHAANL